jgi:hypothetical protein
MTTTSPTRSSWRGRVSALSVGVALVLAAGQLSVNAAVDTGDPGIDAACDDRAREAGAFVDVEPDGPHAGAIGCLAAYRVTQGRFVDGEKVFEPSSAVTRQQMASFVAHTLDQLPSHVYALPQAEVTDFVDGRQISPAHRPNVERLYAAGVVAGYGDDTFRPGEPIDRAQMASFLARAIEAGLGEELVGVAAFDDIEGAHRASVEKLTAIGVVAGLTDTTYGPDASTTRAQMATMVARTLGHFVEAGAMEPVAYARGTATASLALAGVETEAHEGFDRVTLLLEGGDGLAGWDVRYVDHAVTHGSGDEVEVAGDRILEVTLTGMALPPAQDGDLWAEERLVTDGDGIVEIVNRHVYEGRHQLFIGTTGTAAYSVEREAGPQRVVIDVAHHS